MRPPSRSATLDTLHPVNCATGSGVPPTRGASSATLDTPPAASTTTSTPCATDMAATRLAVVVALCSSVAVSCTTPAPSERSRTSSTPPLVASMTATCPRHAPSSRCSTGTAYVSAGRLVTSSAPQPPPYVVMGHVEQLSREGAPRGPKWLLKQGVHAPTVAAPSPSLYVPFEHATQPVEEPAAGWYVPRAQGVHAAAPRAALNDPGAHAEHASADVAPGVPLNLPTGQGVQSTAPAASL